MNPFVRNILLVDDHTLLQHALSSMLESLLGGGRIICASSAQDALSALRSGTRFNLILLDLKLPDSDGLRLLGVLRREAPGVPVAVFSGQDAPIYRQLAREADVDGFLSKSLNPAALVDGVRSLLAGRRFFDEAQVRVPGEPRVQLKLSPKQERVLCCLMEGLSNKEIAIKLDLSERTVKMHLTSVYQVLGVNTRSQAILVGQSLNLSMPSEDA
ncbi:response regulator transcription factor [Uliginosibacterium sediminicola]|uniref:Response regulator transcription factor n=1 Tax=Uliginosibacterium sediminicola TaxID=2024550 RepID=A0ABU9YWR6_9RHOO